MGRAPIPQSSDETPQGYPNQHDNPLSPPQDAYVADNDQNMNHPQSTRSFIPQSPENIPPPPESYPPEKPATYPPHHQSPAAYPPPQPEPVQLPPQQQPVQFPPQQQPVQFPPQQQPVQFPPQQQPVQFPPQQQPVQFPPQQTSYTNYTNYSNAQPPQGVNYGGYQTPDKMAAPDGIAAGVQYLAPTQGWSNNNGLFDCAEDPENAIITACFPCITFGQIAEIVDNGQTSCATSGLIYGVFAFIGIPCIMSCSYRTKIRNRYGLMETPAPDWATHCFCEWCALCQEHRELKARGFDPAIGWQGNMAKNQQQYPVMNPPMNQRMM